MTAAAEILTGLPLGTAIVLATLAWVAGRITAAVIESRSWSRGTDRHRELLHHVDEIAVVGKDVLQELESVGKDVARVADAVESQGGVR